jgi:hypothetical protein
MKQVTCPKCGDWTLIPGIDCYLTCSCGHRWKAKLVDWLKVKHYESLLRRNGQQRKVNNG